MSMTIYKSNKANQGSLFSIKFVAKSNKQGEDFKPGGFFVNIVKQIGWNEEKHIGRCLDSILQNDFSCERMKSLSAMGIDRKSCCRRQRSIPNSPAEQSKANRANCLNLCMAPGSGQPGCIRRKPNSPTSKAVWC